MSDPIAPPPEPVQVQKDIATTPVSQPVPAVPVSLLMMFLALGLGLCFFLPWLKIMGVGVNGFQMQKLGQDALIFWLIPVMSGVVVLTGSIGKYLKEAAQLAGFTPFGMIIYLCIDAGNDCERMLNALGTGAWLAMVIGFLMILLSFKLNSPKA